MTSPILLAQLPGGPGVIETYAVHKAAAPARTGPECTATESPSPDTAAPLIVSAGTPFSTPRPNIGPFHSLFKYKMMFMRI